MTTILILGKNGQVGHALEEAFSGELQCHAFDANGADLADEKKLRKLIGEIKPAVIINAAAFTAVDRAEEDEVTAYRVNARGPQIIGEEAHKLAAAVIHFSTDYVFDGKKKTPYKEADRTNPLNIYGASKLQGEMLLTKACPRSIILRTSWVVGEHGNNFLKTILKLAHERELLRVVDDQVGAPTSARLLSEMSLMLVKQLIPEGGKDFPFGTYHLTARGQTSWCGYAKFVIAEALAQGATLKVTPDLVHPIKTSEYKTLAKRPLNSRLDSTLFETTFGVTLPHWQEAVFAIINSIYQG